MKGHLLLFFQIIIMVCLVCVMASMCDEMSVIYEDGVENGLESVVERLAEERDRVQNDLHKWF